MQATAMHSSSLLDHHQEEDNPFKCSWEDVVLQEVEESEKQGLITAGLAEASKTFREIIQPNSMLESVKMLSKDFNLCRSKDPVNYTCSTEIKQGENSFIYLDISIMEPTKTPKYTEMAKFIVPANHTLSELADAFDCPCDHIIINEKEANGRFFFFENVFYNDTLVDQDLSLYDTSINN